jgi:HEAT repeat protein
VSDQVYALRTHPSAYVRGSVLRYMSRYDPRIGAVMLVEALDDPDYIVRENAVDELDQLGVVEAIPRIRERLADDHPDVQRAAATALENLQSLENSSWPRRQFHFKIKANLA